MVNLHFRRADVARYAPLLEVDAERLRPMTKKVLFDSPASCDGPVETCSTGQNRWSSRYIWLFSSSPDGRATVERPVQQVETGGRDDTFGCSAARQTVARPWSDLFNRSKLVVVTIHLAVQLVA